MAIELWDDSPGPWTGFWSFNLFRSTKEHEEDKGQVLLPCRDEAITACPSGPDSVWSENKGTTWNLVMDHNPWFPHYQKLAMFSALSILLVWRNELRITNDTADAAWSRLMVYGRHFLFNLTCSDSGGWEGSCEF